MHKTNSSRAVMGAIILGLAAVALPALAHHPMDGQTPVNAMQGLLSGLGHPVIEFDHLAFLIALGMLTSLVDNGRLRLIVPFVLVSLVGTYVRAQGVSLPLPEMWVGLSLVVVAGLLLRALKVSAMVAVLFCVLAALAHGYAFGEAVVGARTSAILSYLVGLGVIQSAMLWLVATGIRKAMPTLRSGLMVAAGVVSGVLGVMTVAASAL